MVSCAALGRFQRLPSRQEDRPSHTYLPQRPDCMFSGLVSPPLKPVKCLCLFLMLATRNLEVKETAVLTDCRQKCVNLGKFFFLKKKKVTALVHLFYSSLGSWKEPMQTPETEGCATAAVWPGDTVPEDSGVLRYNASQRQKGSNDEGGVAGEEKGRRVGE